MQANQWWDETISSRVNDPERSVFVVIMQRLHQKDTTGHILEKESNITHLMLPMEFEPERRYDLVLMSESAQYIWLDSLV